MNLIKYKIFCITDNRWETIIRPEGEAVGLACPVDHLHSVQGGSLATVALLPGKAETDSDGNQKIIQLPFASKTIGNKKLYKRVHGIQTPVIAGETEITFVCPYPLAKIEAIQIIGGEIGDTVDLMVHDTPTGTISGVPDKKLNQFGFNVCISPVSFIWRSSYDAELIKDLKLMLVYHTTNPKTVGVSFDINEVK